MKKTGSEMPSPHDDAADGNQAPADVIERARLQADVAQQRVRLAKEELRRARKRLKEAKREARRARKHATAARKDWKRVRKKAKQGGAGKSDQPASNVTRKLPVRSAAATVRRAQSRSSRGKGARSAKTRAHK